MSFSPVSRRDFLLAAGTVALGASAGLAPGALAQGQPASEKKIRVGIVGGGFGAAFHWHQDPNCIVEAVSDLRPERREHLMNVYQCGKSYESLEKLILDPKIDAVAVFTEAPNHVRHCVAVMNAGKHCLCAVPAGLTLEECRELIDAKERNGVRYMMAETSYYRWPTITARKLYEDGKFGNLVYTEGEYYHPGIAHEKDGLSYWNGKRTWRHGYPPMLYPTHSTAFYVGVARERLVEVSCLGETSDDPAFHDNVYHNPFANASALFKTSRGHIMRCNVMWEVWAHGERAQWFGDSMSMFMDGWSGQPYLISTATGETITSQPDYWHLVPEAMRIDSGHGASHPFITHEFTMALVEDREPAVNVYEAVAMTAPGIVAHASALKGGEQMKVPSFDKA